LSRRSRSTIIIIKELLFVGLNLFNVPFVGTLQIHKAGDPSGFQLRDNSASFFKATNVGVRGHSVVGTNMLRSTSKQLGLMGDPVDDRLSFGIIFTKDNPSRAFPSDLHQISCTCITPVPTNLARLQ
jgi:hypothetical protein